MIPQNKMQKVTGAFKLRDEKEKQAEKGGSKSNTNLFFKALSDDEKKSQYHLLMFSPTFLYRKKVTEGTFNDELLELTYPIDMHSFRIGQDYYGIACKKQTVGFSYTKDVDSKCPVCDIGYKMKKKYWDELTPLLEEYGNWQKLPEDIKKDLLIKNKLWKDIIDRKRYDYIPVVAIKILKEDSVVTPTSIEWFKAPQDLMKLVRATIEDDKEWPFAESYNKDGSPSLKEYKPDYIIKMVTEKSEKGFQEYSFRQSANTDYNISVDEDGNVILSNVKLNISNVKIPMTDINSFFENTFSDWESKTKFKQLSEALNIEVAIEESIETLEDDTPESDIPVDEEEINEESFKKF